MNETLPAGKTRWAHYHIAYHFVWIPKYRRTILTGVVETACKRLIASVATNTGSHCWRWQRTWTLYMASYPRTAKPRRSPAVIVGLLKGYTSRNLCEQFPKLKRQCGQEQLRTQAYYVGTAGSVSAEVIRRYIQECQGQ